MDFLCKAIKRLLQRPSAFVAEHVRGHAGKVKNPAQNLPLYFLHIPKTAGTSFVAILHQQFRPEDVCPAYLWHELLAIPRVRLVNYKLFRGHFYHYIDTVLTRKPRYITFLRDPIERSLSHFQHILRDSNHYFHEHVARHRNFLEFLRNPETSPMIENFQTRSIALDLDPVSISLRLDDAALNQLALERTLESAMPSRLSPDELLSKAKKRLDAFFCVGISERFEASIELMALQLGWNRPTGYQKLNVAEQRFKPDDLSAEEIALLQERTQLDHELYMYATRRFERELQAADLY